MSSKELLNFKKKISHLNALLESLETIPGREAELEACENHEEVVSLARSWGFEIGKRWGE